MEHPLSPSGNSPREVILKASLQKPGSVADDPVETGVNYFLAKQSIIGQSGARSSRRLSISSFNLQNDFVWHCVGQVAVRHTHPGKDSIKQPVVIPAPFEI